MALQMSKPLSRYIAEFGINEARKSIVSRFNPIDGIEARPITQVNNGAVVPS
jgi:hypothetical protein